MDWLNQATAALNDSKQSNQDWERRRNTDFNIEFNRPSSLSEIDSKLSAKTAIFDAQLDGMTAASKVRRDAEEEVHNVERAMLTKKKDKKDKKDKKTNKEGTPTKLGKLPVKSMDEFKMEQQTKKKRRKSLNQEAAVAVGPSAAPPYAHKNPAPTQTQKGQVVHKTKMTIDGSLYSITLFQSENHIAFSVVDNLTNEAHKVKTKSKANHLTSKSLREKEFYYEELLSRLSFKAINTSKDSDSNQPRYMQNTGQPQTKKLVLLKLNEINKGGGRAGGESNGVFGGAPFFKESLPIGDIIADCTAHANEHSVKLTFVDSIYNTSTSYMFPACALVKLSQLKVKNSTGAGLDKKAPVLGSKIPSKNLQAVKNLCAKLIILRSSEIREGNADDTGEELTLVVPKQIRDLINDSIYEHEKAVQIQSAFRMHINYVAFKPKMEGYLSRRNGATTIQKLWRKGLSRMLFEEKKMEHKSAVAVQKRIRICNAKSRVEEMRLTRKCVVLIQGRVRVMMCKKIKEVKAEVKAAAERAKVERVAAAKAEVERVAAEKAAAEKAEAERVAAEKATVAIQNRIRICNAASRVNDMRLCKKSAILIQGRVRIMVSRKIMQVKAAAKKAADERAAAEKAAAKKAAEEKAAEEKAEAERVAAAKADVERVAAERAAAEKAEAERVAAFNAAVAIQNRIRICNAASRVDDMRLCKKSAILIQGRVRIMMSRMLVKAKAAAKVEVERVAAERAEAERVEAERVAAVLAAVEKAEVARVAVERAAAEKAEAERVAAFNAAAKAEVERVAAEKAATEKAEAERVAAFNAAVAIQKRIRICNAASRVDDMRLCKKSAILIQGRVRITMCRKLVKAKAAAKKAADERAAAENAVSSAVVIQKYFRRYAGTLYVENLKKIEKNINDMKLKLKKLESSIVIQKYTRKCILARNVIASLRGIRKKEEEKKRTRDKLVYDSSVLIQKRIRICNAMVRVEGMREALRSAILIQGRVRIMGGKKELEIRARAKREKEVVEAKAEAERVEGERVEAERAEAERVEIERAEAERVEAERAAVEKLERESSVVVQSAWRVYWSRRLLKKRRDKMFEVARAQNEKRGFSAVRIQTKIRACLARWRVEGLRAERLGALKIQSVIRQRQGATKVRGVRRSIKRAKLIQTVWRGKSAKAKFMHLLELHNAAMYIQCQARIIFSKNIAAERRARLDGVKWGKMILIQKNARMALARWAVAEMRERGGSALTIQMAVRCWVAREHLKNKKFFHARYVKKIVLVQSLVRQKQSAGYTKQWQDWWAWEEVNAVIIQARVRGIKARREMVEWKDYWKKYALVSKIQARARGMRVRKEYFFEPKEVRPKSPLFFSWVRHQRFDDLQEVLDWQPTFTESVCEVEGEEFDVDMRAHGGRTLLMTAAQIGCKRIVKDLIKAGCDKDAVNEDGNSACHMAFLYGFADLGYYMIDTMDCDDGIENEGGLDCYAMSGGLEEGKRPDMYLGDGALGSDIKLVYDGGDKNGIG